VNGATNVGIVVGSTAVTLAEPLFPSLVAVIVAVPGVSVATRPAPDTVATALLELLHDTVRPESVAPAASFVVAPSWVVAPASTVGVGGLTSTVATGAGVFEGGGEVVPGDELSPPPQAVCNKSADRQPQTNPAEDRVSLMPKGRIPPALFLTVAPFFREARGMGDHDVAVGRDAIADFFRGFLFGALRRWQLRVAGHDIGPWIAAVIVGILFGLAHTGSASSQYLVPLGYLGFVLCIMRWKTRSLYPCIALHAFNNALALGVNELHWSTPGILGLVVASAAAVGALTLPLADREAPLTQKM